ncbi:MAG: hypothetical protein ACI9GM_000198 [Salibacteraceae bacterium]|jgi:hypothetical protein
MRNKLLYTLALTTILSSCTKDFDDMNVNKKRPTEVPAQSLFANAAKSLNRQVVTLNVNYNNLKLWSQYLTQVTYTDEANYNLINRNIPQTEWLTMYRNTLQDFKEAVQFTNSETWVLAEDIGAQKNRLAITEIYVIYSYERLTTIFGDVPYSEALGESNLPKFDDAATIYADLDTRLTAAIANLDENYGSFDGGYDNLFAGDIGMWKKFAYGLKLKMAMTLADVNPGKALTMFTAAEANVFTQGESASFIFLGSQPNTNPMWEDLVNSGRNDYVASNTIVDTMLALNDPRISTYFTTAPDTTAYIGGDYGAPSPYSGYSHIASYFLSTDQPTILMDYMEMEFYKAEAAARGWGGVAETHYNNAITESMLNWGYTSTDAATYLAGTDVAYTMAGGSDLDKIGTQAWLAYFNRGMLGWTTYRRLDMAGQNGTAGDDLMNQAAQTDELTPVRYTYPINEQTLNGSNYSSAASAIGGDLKSTRLWWDTK